MEFDRLNTSRVTRTSTNSGQAQNQNRAEITTSGMGNQAKLNQATMMLESLFKAYGLKFPEISMNDPKLKDKVVSIGKVAEIAKTNKTALSQMLKHTAVLMSGQVALAEFYAASTQIAVEGKKRVDKATADAFLMLAGYNQHTQQLTGKVERKLKAMESRSQVVEELGEGKLKTALKLNENQKELGARREERTIEAAQEREELLESVGIRRKKDANYIRYGHLK